MSISSDTAVIFFEINRTKWALLDCDPLAFGERYDLSECAEADTTPGDSPRLYTFNYTHFHGQQLTEYADKENTGMVTSEHSSN
jgi:hypothetical protein